MQPQTPQLLKIKPAYFFHDRFTKNLSESSAVIEPLTALCGGWYLQTFKQITNKLNKNKSAPLPYFFSSSEAMDGISKNKQLLKEIFKAFDTRKLGRIDAFELYATLLTLSKGTYENYLKAVIDVFGFENPGRITRNELFFFLDSLYRALPKILVLKEELPDVNLRLDAKSINSFLDQIFEEDKPEIERNEIYELLMRSNTLNVFLRHIHKRCTASAETSRNTAIDRLKNQSEVRRCVMDMIHKVEAALNEAKKPPQADKKQ